MVFFYSSCFLFCSITGNTKLHFNGLSMLSSIKCTSANENTKYKQIFCAVWRYPYGLISFNKKIPQRICYELVNDLYIIYIARICIGYHMKGEVISVLSLDRETRETISYLSRVSATNEGQNMIS